MKEEAVSAVSELHAKGTRCIIVSGDNQELADKVGQKAGADEVHGHCLPEDKVRLVSEFCKKGTTVFVGDGVNDVCMLEAAGHGVAMGNAVPETKAAAEYVTDDIDKDGVYNGLKHYGLI